MRKSTLLWLLLAAFCGYSLFYTSQRAHDSHEKLSRISQDVLKEEESLRVLHAEWSYLNQPARLEKLSKEHLKLIPLKGRQFIRIEDIPLRSLAPQVAEEVPVVIKINPPPKEAAAQSVHPAHKHSLAATAANGRDLRDVMKSLGVER